MDTYKERVRIKRTLRAAGYEIENDLTTEVLVLAERGLFVIQETEEDETEKGRYIALLLSLKMQRHSDRYDTAYGNKTALGLYRTLQNIIKTPANGLPETFSPDTLAKG